MTCILYRDASSFPLNSFNAVLTQLQKLAPEFHRVSCRTGQGYYASFPSQFFCKYLCLSIIDWVHHTLLVLCSVVYLIVLQARYLQYLNALHHDDYVAALDNLHGYFDCRYGLAFIRHNSNVKVGFAFRLCHYSKL